LKKGLMSEEKLNEILSPESMTKPGVVSAKDIKK
jgi:aspartate ammonia-lyase